MSGEKDKPRPVSAEKANEPPLQNLSKEVIEYLSKEIETTTTNMMVYRTKVAFAVYLGPFIILIAVVTKGISFSLNLDSIAIAAISVNLLCFLTLAYMNARIERQAWLQCNKWRGLIASLHNDPSTQLTKDQLFDRLYGDDPGDELFAKWRSQLAYVAAYSVLVISFIMSIIIIARLRTPEPPQLPPTSFSIQSLK